MIPPYTVAVRALCEFAAKRGDLDLRFTPSPTSQEGIAGHQAVVARRRPGYLNEVPVSGQYKSLIVRGRADGYDAEQRLLEEVKTFKGELARMPDNHRQLHWAQAKVYAALLCRQLELSELSVSLVYFDTVDRKEEPPLVHRYRAEELQAFFETLCERFIAWADSELEHRASRDHALGVLRFPHASFRSGQRSLSEAAFRAVRAGRCLMAQAPTGIGKTIGTLFPLLKACPGEKLDRIFFLTAKGSGKALAFEALETIAGSVPEQPLRVVELVAREKSCEHPDRVCHGDSCPLASGFYDRLPAARTAAVTRRTLTREALREIGLAHAVCPYYLGQEVARWCDVVVGDYNHYFDNSALLHSLTEMNAWRTAVLVDEAHNLVERARDMYSAALHSSALREMRATAPTTLRKPLNHLDRAWRRLTKDQAEAYRVHESVPRHFESALKDAASAIAELLADSPVGAEGGLLRFHFDLLRLTRLLETFGAHSIFDVTLDEPGASGKRRTGSTLCLRNVVPAPFLKRRFTSARSTVLFSATLTPQHFYADTLGLPGDVVRLDVEAPFSADQLSVRIVPHSTRYRHRSDSLLPIADLIAGQYDAQPGNYLAFFSSHEYLQRAASVFSDRYPRVPMWEQGRRMDDAARESFLARFRIDGCGIGFAVLGGSFAEAIDLAGTRLIGAFVATLGLPQFNPVNEELRARLESCFGAGYDYTYLFPGIRKVVQAAGRVIRSPSDRGTLHLIDDRFGHPEVLRLLPAWWRIELDRRASGNPAPEPGPR